MPHFKWRFHRMLTLSRVKISNGCVQRRGAEEFFWSARTDVVKLLTIVHHLKKYLRVDIYFLVLDFLIYQMHSFVLK